MKPYLEAILEGRKTIETRLTIHRRDPFMNIAGGERISFRQSSGPYRASATVKRVVFQDGLTPALVRAIRVKYGQQILGDDQFWQWKSTAKFATLIWLTDVQPTSTGPDIGKSQGVAWFCLPIAGGDTSEAHSSGSGVVSAAPIVIPLHKSNIEHCHVRIPSELRHRFPEACFGGATKDETGAPITLIFEDGSSVETDIVSGRNLVRWRGWRKWFGPKHWSARPGDAVMLTAMRPGRYIVTFRRGGG